MDSSNEDEEPKVCTVFASADATSAKTVFDTIAFVSPKKEDKPATAPPEESTSSLFSSHIPGASSVSATILPRHSSAEEPKATVPGTSFSETIQRAFISDSSQKSEAQNPTGRLSPDMSLTGKLSSLDLQSGAPVKSIEGSGKPSGDAAEVPLPQANLLFADSPEIPFPVGLETFPAAKKVGNRGSDCKVGFITYAVPDPIADAWIPTEETRKVLLMAATRQGNFVADKSQVTMPGIVLEDNLVDKVALNMSRIYGEAEANKRKILNADSVKQDDEGLRELIKLGCYRSAVNLTKRMLTLYGQGPGKIGQPSKHSVHSLQLWYTRITLLVRLRDFANAALELAPFNSFENADMFYEYYPDLSAQGNYGSMVPFHFRLLAAEVPQYLRKTNETFDALTKIWTTVEQIIANVTIGQREDGNPIKITDSWKEKSLQIWCKREIRVLYSLANASIFSKDFKGAVLYLSKLLQKDTENEMQLKSALGRLFLQYGDVDSAQRYFTMASQLSHEGTDGDRVDVLVDSSLLAIGTGKYKQAYDLLRQAVEIQPDNYMVINNMAVCLVYMGRVKDALALMETTVKQNAPQLLQENVVRNLSTIYELENSDGSKKNSLLKLISEYKGDGVDLSALKMPNLI